MSTTLEEARKALLHARRRLTGYVSKFSVASGCLAEVADYLDNQVPLAVENEQLRARLAHAESFMNTTNALPSQLPQGNFVSCTSDPNALNPELGNRRFFAMSLSKSGEDKTVRQTSQQWGSTITIPKNSDLGRAISVASDNGKKQINLMEALRHSDGNHLANTVGPQITVSPPDILKNCNKFTPLHWCLKADCNCNTCVKERGYIV